MPRRRRVQYGDALYHVINRGNYRLPVFASVGAGCAFETTLGEASEMYGWRIHAHVVMRNHFHLLGVGDPATEFGRGYALA